MNKAIRKMSQIFIVGAIGRQEMRKTLTVLVDTHNLTEEQCNLFQGSVFGLTLAWNIIYIIYPYVCQNCPLTSFTGLHFLYALNNVISFIMLAEI